MHATRETIRDLIPGMYGELRSIAHRYFRQQRAGFTLQPTELVDEACLQLISQPGFECNDPAHFRAIAANKIWHVVVDHVRRKQAAKRGGSKPSPQSTNEANAYRDPGASQRIPLDSITVEWQQREVDLLDLADAMDRLCRERRRLYDVIRLHWFGGLSHAEVASVLGVSESTAEKDFRYALAWLNRTLSGNGAHAD